MFNGKTALHIAASSSLVEPMKVLLDFNADVELQVRCPLWLSITQSPSHPATHTAGYMSDVHVVST